MVAITERAEWAEQIRQIEANDPVQGGENGIDNIPHQQLANRTAYLKKQFDDLKKNHLSNNDLEDGLDSDASNKALTANQGKILKELIDSKSSQDDFTQSFAQNGYCKLPNGLMMQWGYYHLDANPNDTEHRVSFPTPFDRACFSLIGTRVAIAGNTHEGDGGMLVIAFNQNEFRVALQNFNATSNAVRGFYWQAIGF